MKCKYEYRQGVEGKGRGRKRERGKWRGKHVKEGYGERERKEANVRIWGIGDVRGGNWGAVV